MKPMPPWREMAIARRESVTVSIAAATIGIFSEILRERQVRVSACAGSTEDLPGSSSTSSNVNPSGIGPSIIHFSSGRSGSGSGAVERPNASINTEAQPKSLGSKKLHL